MAGWRGYRSLWIRYIPAGRLLLLSGAALPSQQGMPVFHLLRGGESRCPLLFRYFLEYQVGLLGTCGYASSDGCLSGVGTDVACQHVGHRYLRVVPAHGGELYYLLVCPLLHCYRPDHGMAGEYFPEYEPAASGGIPAGTLCFSAGFAGKVSFQGSR